MSIHLLERPDLHSGLAHVDQEITNPLMLGNVKVGSCQQNPEIGMMRAGIPDLLPVNAPPITITLGFG